MDRSQLRARRRGMNTAEMLQDMSDKELARNARRGGQMAIEEQDRRDHAFELPSNSLSDLERSVLMEVATPDWRIL